MPSIGYKVNSVTSVPTVSSGAQEWIQWHKELKSSFGKKAAAHLFMLAWAKRGNESANTYDLRQYLGKEGISIDSNALDKAVDLGGSALDWVEGFGTGAKWVLIIILVIILGGAGMAVFNLAKAPAKSIKTITRL